MKFGGNCRQWQELPSIESLLSCRKKMFTVLVSSFSFFYKKKERVTSVDGRTAWKKSWKP
jgi:hypothetical protein